MTFGLDSLTMEPLVSKCDCDPNVLLQRERQYNRWDDTRGFVWCSEHRVFVMFEAPKEHLDARLAVSAPASDPQP